MALPLMTRRRLLAAKKEATYGTAESLTTAEAVMNIFDSEVVAQGDITEREGQSALSRLPGVPGTMSNKTTFKSEVYGGGSTPVPYWATHLLAGCGMNLATATFSPITPPVTGLTFGSYRAGTLATSAGNMGNFTMRGQTGKPVMIDWDFSGSYIVPTDTAILAPTYPTVLPPAFMGATLTIGGTAYNILDFELSPNNTVSMREIGNQSAVSFGYMGGVIVNRGWTFKATVEAVLMATQNWFSSYTAGTTSVLNLVLGSASNNTITIGAPVMQLKKPPVPTDRNGYIVYPLEFDCVRSAAAGDDEVTILFA